VLAQALALVEMGYSIFPIQENTKIPAVKWSTQSTTDLDEVRDWWEDPRLCNDNIGINCGESGCFVVDLDTQAHVDVFMKAWFRRESDPPRVIVETPRDGGHIYFEAPASSLNLGNTSGKLGAGMDTRGVGGMVLAPGSVINGRAYTVLRGTLSHLPPLPYWIIEKVRPKPLSLAEERRRAKSKWLVVSPYRAEAELRHWCDKVIHAPEGTQNNTINIAAFVLAKDYCPPLDPEEIRHALERAAREGHHPERRADGTIASGLTRGLGNKEGDSGHDRQPQDHRRDH
jgi:hypothetical protein